MPMKSWHMVTMVALFAAGMAFGVVGVHVLHTEQGAGFLERREGARLHINPLLECDTTMDVASNKGLEPLREKVAHILNTPEIKGRGCRVGVYFRRLDDGLWFGIGEEDKFIPASLRKLPLMIALLKMSEAGKDPHLLDRLVTCELAIDYNAKQNIKPSRVLVRGQAYSVNELIYRMIVYSDNNAFMLLAGIVDPAELNKVYSLLRVLHPRTSTDDSFRSVQTYSSFFRVLYNATYLSREASERALAILAQSEFRDGLVAGVPPTVEVAHKFGEHSDPDQGTVQLHDCGIVYYPGSPYLLCIMSSGPDFPFLDHVVGTLSQTVFTEVSALRSAR